MIQYSTPSNSYHRAIRLKGIRMIKARGNMDIEKRINIPTEFGYLSYIIPIKHENINRAIRIKSS